MPWTNNITKLEIRQMIIHHESSLKDKVCMVTGANSGIGKATAQGIVRLGATVVMVCQLNPNSRYLEILILHA